MEYSIYKDRRVVMKIIRDIADRYKRIAATLAIISFLAIIYFAMVPGGTVAAASYVISATGPISGALVKLVAYPQYNATTDINGQYTMPNVPEGTYVISASKDGYFPNTSTVTVVGGSTVTKDFTLAVGYKVFVPWTATTQGWTTPYVIANKGSSNANVIIDYYNQADGSKVGNYSLSVLPGASKFVFREWNAPNTDGSAVLLSDQPITVMVDQFGTNLFGAYEVDQSGSSEEFLPYTATTGGWTTPYVIVNRGTATATVSITYYNLAGSPAGSNSVDILPGASKFVFREWNTSTDGAAKLSSTQNISVLVDMFGPGNKFAAYTPASIADTKVFIPWTATTQGWTTPYKIVNRGSSAATVNISYYNQANGLLAGTDSVSINPNQVVTVSRESTTANGTDGSAVLNSTQPISLIVQQFNNAEGKFEVYTPAMTANNTIVVPWTSTTQGWTTPYVIVNEGTATATVNIQYYNQADGSSVGTYPTSILPGASKFVFREWTTSNTDGSAVVVSDQPITVMVDQFNNGQNKFGAYTPVG
jgi:hypothetical protein